MALDVSPDGKTIAFDLLGKIFTLPITGGKATQLTIGPAFDEMPRFSRDGRHVLFSTDRGKQIELWRVPREGGAPTLAPVAERTGIPLALDINRTNSDPATWAGTERSAGNSAAEVPELPTIWGPDGRHGVRSTRPGGALLYRTEECQVHARATLMLVDRSTGSTKPLSAAGPDCMFLASMPPSAFTPDGRAFITANGGKIWRISVPSGETEQIPFVAEVQMQVRPRQTYSHRISDDPLVHARMIEHARVAPDRTQVVFGAFDRLWSQLLPSGAPRRLTQLDVGEFQPIWSPDGRHVAFVTWDDKKGEGAIWRVRLSTSCARRGHCQPERLTTVSGRYTQPAYSPDGRRIAAMHVSVGGRVGTFSARLFWIPAIGGSNTYFGEKRDLNVEFSNLYFRAGDSGQAIEVQTLAEFSDTGPRHLNLRCVVGRQPLAGTVSATERSATLSISDAPRADPPWHDRSGLDYPCAGALSPAGNQVIFRRINGDLYLMDLPVEFGTADQTIKLMLDRAQRISPEGLGGDSPHWSDDGRLITFTFGHSLYLYGPPRDAAGREPRPASLQAIPIDVAIPRNLPTEAIVFRNARLITMRGDEVIERGDLLVRGRRITALGPGGTIAVPADARILDARGLTIIPGLLDLHNHALVGTFAPHVHDSRNAILETNLAFGVLNSRDPQSYVTDVLTTEDLIEAGSILAPRIRSTFVGVGNSSAAWLATMERARQAVHRYGEEGVGVGYIKEYVSGPRRQRQVLVMAAAEESLNVTSHGTGLKHLLTNAMDGYGGFDHPIVAVPLYDDVIQLLAKTQISWADNNWRWGLTSYFMAKLTDAEKQKLHRLYKPRAYGALGGSLDSLLLRDSHMQRTDAASNDDPAAAMRMSKSLATAIRKGARIVNGSHGDDVPGLGTHLQIWAYVEGGASPLEALRTSTLWSAEALDWGLDLGSLDVGKLADLVVLDHNPLDRIQNTIAIRYVMSNGRLYDAETLAEAQLSRE